MNAPLIDTFLLGIGIALNPAAVIAIILILTRTRSTRSGAAFLAGWVSGLILLVILPSLVIMEALRRVMGVSAWLPAWAWLVIGGALLAAAVLSLRDRARGMTAPATPRWQSLLAGNSASRVFGLGVTLSLASLRNVVLLAAAVALISNADLALRGVLVASAVFLVASSLGVLAPLLVALLGGDRSTSLLETGGDWLQRNLIWLKIIVLAAVGAGMLLHGLRLMAQA